MHEALGEGCGRLKETMTLSHALRLVHDRRDASKKRTIFLVCQFEPLHLATFLQAHFAARFAEEACEIQRGLYGDLEGSIGAAAASHADAAILTLEWSDLDPRLGTRSSGGWSISSHADILESCRKRFGRVLDGLRAIGAKMPVALIPPTLAAPLVAHTAGWQLSLIEAELQKEAASFVLDAAHIPGVAVLNTGYLDRASSVSARADVAMELRAGFPYSTAHASALANQVVSLLFPPSPMKGLITDLDETFWSGIVGEVGADAVVWSLGDHAQVHGLYQQMLSHLSEMGVLLGIASKNDPAVVEQALSRADLLVPAKSFFPVRANWGRKSESIRDILGTWNIGADSVVFIDDSPMELDEVQAAYPSMTCLRFSKKPAETLELLEKLRDLFGKPAVRQEDALRQASIRANSVVQGGLGGDDSAGFIRDLQGKVIFDSRKDPSNKRLLELINKTNQFNLNGVRVGESEWIKRLEDTDSLVVGVAYEEKFGPLGTIGVLAGNRVGDRFEITHWVLSCRAFSRKIEHHMLNFVFDQCAVDTIRLAFHPTERNQPLQTFLTSLDLDVGGSRAIHLSREHFRNRVEALPHEVRLQE